MVEYVDDKVLHDMTLQSNSEKLGEMLSKCEAGKGFVVPANIKFGDNIVGSKMHFWGKKLNCKFKRRRQADGSIHIWRE